MQLVPQGESVPQFETFTKRRARVAGEPTLTIQAKGGLGFNHAAYEALEEPKAVELLFDRTARIIGVRSVDPSEPHAYPVKSPSEKRDSGFLIGGRSFCQYFDIDTTVARRWVGYLDGDVLCIDLNSPSREVTGPRAAKKKEVVVVQKEHPAEATRSPRLLKRPPGV